jgi:hypothetical protein
VLQEVELLVGCGGPEVLAAVGLRLAALLSPAVGDGDAALLAEGQALILQIQERAYQSIFGVFMVLLNHSIMYIIKRIYANPFRLSRS